MNCPDCGGATWDNRESKRNPKQPDYKCKDKECGKGVWSQKKAGGGNGASNGNAPAARERWTWGDLFAAYDACHKRIVAVQGEKASPESINAGVATLLIAAGTHNLPGPQTAVKRAEAVKAAEESARKQREEAAKRDPRDSEVDEYEFTGDYQ